MGRPGQSLIEIIVAVGLAAAMLPAVLTGLVASREGQAQGQQRTEALALSREVIEAVRQVRNTGWSGLSNGTFHPTAETGNWKLEIGSETVGDFTRSIVVEDYVRSGSVDPSMKKITTTVSWTTPLPNQIVSEFYLSRYLDNLNYVQTTEAEFNTGTKTGTVVTNTAGGEVTLAAGGSGNWCAPDLSISALDLPKSGVANALTAIEGKAFAGTGDNASGVSFANVSISNTTPPVASIVGTFDGFKTNGVFGEASYAYLATDSNSKEIEIINLTTNPYSEAGYFNAPGNGSGNSVWVAGNVGYMTDGAKLYIFDLSSKSGSRSQLGVVNSAGEGRRVVVVGTYAYVVTENVSNQLQIVDVGNSTSPVVVGQAGLSGGEGKDVFVNSTGTRAYVVTAKSDNLKEMFVVDTSTKTGGRPTIGSYEASGMNPKGVAAVSGNKVIMVGTGGEEYQVVNVTVEDAPVRCGGLQVDTGINGVSAVSESDGDAYAYIITGDSGSEFKMIAGGPGGQYSVTGTFESATFDAGHTSAFNRLTFSGSRPANTNLTAQIAVSADCNGFVFVGPDGTSGTFFDGSGQAVDVTLSSGRCMRYKAFLDSTDPGAAPSLNDITINYSP